MNVLEVVKAGVTLWQLFSHFRRSVPRKVRKAAAMAVQSASVLDHLKDHASRREWAVLEVMKQTGCKENHARLAVEALVGLLKRG